MILDDSRTEGESQAAKPANSTAGEVRQMGLASLAVAFLAIVGLIVMAFLLLYGLTRLTRRFGVSVAVLRAVSAKAEQAAGRLLDFQGSLARRLQRERDE